MLKRKGKGKGKGKVTQAVNTSSVVLRKGQSPHELSHIFKLWSVVPLGMFYKPGCSSQHTSEQRQSQPLACDIICPIKSDRSKLMRLTVFGVGTVEQTKQPNYLAE
eukprot:1152881-Pelagomonas_calceolata.AAC.10